MKSQTIKSQVMKPQVTKSQTMKSTAIIAAVFGMLLASCGQSKTEEPQPVTLLDDSKTKPTDIQAVVTANNRFAIDFYQAHNQDTGKNLFFSPYSLATALAMTYQGATGNTQKQMAKVLHFPDKQTLNKGSAGIYNQINKQETVELRTANAFWLQKGFALKSSFTSTVADYYGGQVSLLDFASKPANAAATINRYVENQTNNKIKDLVNPASVRAAKLVLTNAVYFKGAWSDSFEADMTRDDVFHLANNGKIKTPFMTKLGEQIAYYDNNALQMIRLPYKGNQLAMLVVLPKNNQKLASALSFEALKTWRAGLGYTKVNLHLPKFKLTQSYKLAESLSNMGMPEAFSNQAQFKMMSSRDLKIDQVLHKAFVEVNEKGTEAAAATAVTMVATSAPPPAAKPKEFRADRPFLFMIEQVDTGNILFMGQVNNPSSN